MTCVLCGGQTVLSLAGIKDFFVAEGASPEFSLVQCERCQIGFSQPAMSNAELAFYYPSDYAPYNMKRDLLSMLQSIKVRLDVSSLSKLIPASGGSVFEIGAGRGEFLGEAKRAGYAVAGLEPGEAGRATASEHWGLALESGYAEDLHFKARHDLVVARHVLEHINDPLTVLRKVFQDGLKPGGCLYLKIPRLDSWEFGLFKRFWSGLDMPRHRVHFTASGIESLLRSIGFVDIKVRKEVVPIDLMRNLEWAGKYGQVSWARIGAKLLKVIPGPIRLGVLQTLALLLSPFRPGRMIVTARRPT
jgi:SAM-dependent methyltransferase